MPPAQQPLRPLRMPSAQAMQADLRLSVVKRHTFNDKEGAASLQSAVPGAARHSACSGWRQTNSAPKNGFELPRSNAAGITEAAISAM
jgi:hypothetical protein